MKIVPGGGQAAAQGMAGGPTDAQDEVFDPSKGQFDVTISTGPSYQSQREEATHFADIIIAELEQLPIAPMQKSSLLSLAIKLKNLGPLGDEMAKIIDPQGDQTPLPPQVQAAVSHMQQNMQAMQGELSKLTMERQAKVLEHHGKMEEIAAKSQADMALEDKKLLTAVTVAEINTKAQNAADREADRRALESQFHDQAHDVAMAAQGHQQAQEMQAQQADTQSQQSAQDAAQSQQAQQQQAEQQPTQD